MDVFNLRKEIISDYASYVRSFIQIFDRRIAETVEREIDEGLLWPFPLIQLNPAFESGGSVDDLVQKKILHPRCAEIFRTGKSETDAVGKPMFLYRHQSEAIQTAKTGNSYVLTTGTGSGKSLSYIIPIVDYILSNGSEKGIKAIIVYPMNALANSQEFELEKFLKYGKQEFPVSYHRYTGQEDELTRQNIIANPPDIILTNYVMLELILTRPYERKLVEAASNLKFLVFDELHTYRGRQGADVGMLIRRLRNLISTLGSEHYLQCIGTSATLAGPGTFTEQKHEVAQIATKLFGSEVKPDNIIVETLKPETVNTITDNINDARFVQYLADDIKTPHQTQKFESFIYRPLVVWIENTLGVEKNAEGRLVRCKPRPIEGKNGLSDELASLTNLPVEDCLKALKETLLAGYYIKNKAGKPVFAFKLHQFLSRGDTVYASLEDPNIRSITLHGQKYAPDRKNERVTLFPLLFCRECGMEYYSVWKGGSADEIEFYPRAVTGTETEDKGTKGYLFIQTEEPWPESLEEQMAFLPEAWMEEHKGSVRIKKTYKTKLPIRVFVRKDGTASLAREEGTLAAWFIPAPFIFCFNCHISYASQAGEFSKLASLGTEGRSTATTILSMSTVRHLQMEEELEEKARKFLCFSDNRQDASLQSGHFNDFVEIGLIRSALFNALEQAGDVGISHDELALKVFHALGLGFPSGIFPPERYSAFPEARYSRAEGIKKDFLNVLSYRIYSDLVRGWRIVAPNLEQCGLLNIEYEAIDEICNAEDLWNRNNMLAECHAKDRKDIILTLLNSLRRKLAINLDLLEEDRQYSLKKQSSQNLIDPWAIDENEKLRHASIAFLCPSAKLKYQGDIAITPASTFGKYFSNILSTSNNRRLSKEETTESLQALFSILFETGLLTKAERNKMEYEGYQIPASAMRWKAGDGSMARHDTLRVHFAEGRQGRTNKFFIDMYRSAVKNGMKLFSREHTAQVSGELREERERDFREASLPILYCSPTMELGVDISQLYAVGMRNVPPTPANYAQRSGRAGRSGQPALILTYCALGNAHDQHFFRFPEEMVAGSVTTPRLDLANEDLIRAHVHALWIFEARLDLQHSLKDLLDVSGDIPTLALLESVQAHLSNQEYKTATILRAQKILKGLDSELKHCGWYNDNWLQETVNNIAQRFEEACERWRSLYRSAVKQRETQNAISGDATRTQDERELARKLRAEADTQIDLLLLDKHVKNASQSDFYSYRYFASEGFLPGYNFPRLPLSAFIPSRKAGGVNSYISRARFLAISEFGPGSIIYHEGCRYSISHVIMDVQEDGNIGTGELKQCDACGYVHTCDGGKLSDTCEMCNKKLPAPLKNLFRMRNVATIRRQRITSDEEERLRTGYKLRVGYRFVEHGGMPSHRDAQLRDANGDVLLDLKYGHGANLWRINMGWANRPSNQGAGFILNLERGTWLKEGKSNNEEYMDDASGTERTERVIPYVQDRKNCLLMVPHPSLKLDASRMYSLQAAFKQAIQQIYQLEDFEIATETMPATEEPNSLLFIEAAEGGAGVLRRLVDDDTAITQLARKALEVCHFDPDTGADRHKAPHATENCVVACYDCLLNYGNQRIHAQLDRHGIKDVLMRLAGSSGIAAAPKAQNRTSHFESLAALCDSNLEKKWLQFVFDKGYKLPSEAQHRIAACHTVPDFFYEPNVAVYIDGAIHEFPDRAQRDAEQEDCLENGGFIVFRFKDWEQWQVTLDNHPDIFGAKL